jgi:hypothetical protein
MAGFLKLKYCKHHHLWYVATFRYRLSFRVCDIMVSVCVDVNQESAGSEKLHCYWSPYPYSLWTIPFRAARWHSCVCFAKYTGFASTYPRSTFPYIGSNISTKDQWLFALITLQKILYYYFKIISVKNLFVSVYVKHNHKFRITN